MVEDELKCIENLKTEMFKVREELKAKVAMYDTTQETTEELKKSVETLKNDLTAQQ